MMRNGGTDKRFLRAFAICSLLGLNSLAGQSAPGGRALAAGKERTVSLAFAGDTMMGSHYPSSTELPPEDGKRLFEQVAPIFKTADAVCLNLEGVLFDGQQIRPTGDSRYAFRYLMPTRYAKLLKEAGVTVANQANNHVMDGLPAGLASSLEALRTQGVQAVGVPGAPEAIVQIGAAKVRVGFIGFAPHGGTLGFEIPDMQARVRALKARVDIVAVTFHAGAEGASARHVPKLTERFLGANRGDVHAFAHAAVDAGADVVVGHGPHVLRGMEIYKDRLIAYSLGNFLNYGRFNLSGVSALGGILVVELGPAGEVLGGRLVSTIQEKGGKAWLQGVTPAVDANHRAAREIGELSRADFGLSAVQLDAEGRIHKAMAKQKGN